MQQAPLAQRIADAGRLDLDHVGAEVGQRLAGERAGDQLAELEHLQSLQRAAAKAWARGRVGGHVVHAESLGSAPAPVNLRAGAANARAGQGLREPGMITPCAATSPACEGHESARPGHGSGFA